MNPIYYHHGRGAITTREPRVLRYAVGGVKFSGISNVNIQSNYNKNISGTENFSNQKR